MSKARVLYIDDETDLLELASNFFEDENLPLKTCSDINDALTLVRENKYDVIISDAKLPSGSGPDFFRKIKSEGYKGKMILVSGNVQDPEEIKQMGYAEVMYKPIDFFGLIDKVKALLS